MAQQKKKSAEQREVEQFIGYVKNMADDLRDFRVSAYGMHIQAMKRIGLFKPLDVDLAKALNDLRDELQVFRIYVDKAYAD